ncbi:MAG: hypothetical protein LBL08_03660 [Candidatus Nomurabacteria bacterium]|jgi:hypothetical protein|nr:hypothetical protein [Candidatus Nomurabacteria bacterium]
MEKSNYIGKKSAIYVDIDDDLTTIITKVRASSAEIIALVPPKRVGLLQSAVNLKLLAKAAGDKKKKLILITSDNALAILAAGAKIPTAHSLTAEPKLAELPELDETDDVIEGVIAPQKTIIKQVDNNKTSAAVKAIADDDKIKLDDLDDDSDKMPIKKKKTKVPNFNKFRKLLIIGIIAGAALIGVLIWLIFFATSATITITAKTSDEKIDQPIFISTSGETESAQNKIKAVVVDPIKKTIEIEFKATGKRDIGKPATGEITLTCSLDASIGPSCTVPGTVNINGKDYKVNSNNDQIASGGGSAKLPVTAADNGESYNLSAGVQISVNSYLTGTTEAISGGVKKTEYFVTKSDLDAVKIKADAEQKDTTDQKTELESRFGSDVRPIGDSFKTETKILSPAVNTVVKQDEVTKAGVEVSSTMIGLNNNDLNALLSDAAQKKISGMNNQGIFDNGYGGLQILSFQYGDNGGTARLVATAKVGPNLDDAKIKEEAVGKKKNEVKELLEKTDGVDSVEVNYFPFWVTVAPSIDKIKVEKVGF